MNVPPSTIWSQIVSYSSCEPSTQWMAEGLVRFAIFSTQRIRWVFWQRGTDTSRFKRAFSFTAASIGLSNHSTKSARHDEAEKGSGVIRTVAVPVTSPTGQAASSRSSVLPGTIDSMRIALLACISCAVLLGAATDQKDVEYARPGG